MTPSSVFRSRLVGIAVVAALLAVGCGGGPAGELVVSGPDGLGLVGADDVGSVRIEVDATLDRTVSSVVVRHNGEPVDPDEQADDHLAWSPGTLDDGEHTITVEDAPEGDEDPTPLGTWTFVVDTTAPQVTVTEPSVAVVAGDPVTLAGTAEPGATLAVDGEEVTVDDAGAFRLELPAAEAGTLRLTAEDEAGNRTTTDVDVLTVPSRVEADGIHALHVTAHAWAHDGLRGNVLQMIEDNKIDAVQLDLKDEGGLVGYDTEIELARAAGSAGDVYDLEEAVAQLHELDVPVIGRIVAFRDGRIGQYAIDNGHTDWLIQTSDGVPYTGRYSCCFLSFANEEMVEYNIAIAEEAAAAGVDAILWDYVRRPDGDVDRLVFPGLGDRTPEQGVADFVATADERLARWGVQHGASVYGIAATRPTQIGQDIPLLARHLDIVAPMVYPSHWGPGEYDLANPNREPFEIVSQALAGFQEAIEGTDARVVPWLEDTAYRAWDRPLQIREQQRGAAEVGIDEWMMWDPSVKYTPSAYRVLTDDA